MAPPARHEDQSSSAKGEIVALIPALRAFARTFYRNVDDADDLVQETLMKALGNTHLSTAVQNPATRRRKTRPGGSGLRHGARAYQ